MKKDSKSKIASVYAEALYEAAEELKAVAKVHADVLTLMKVIKQEKNFAKYFANPLWEIASKKAALKEIASKLKLSKESLNCLDVIADNNRFAETELILEAFIHLYYKKQGITEIAVDSALKLTETQNKKVLQMLEQKFGKKIVVNYNVDPELLGGLRVQYGSTMIDDSVLGKLNRLEIMMKGGQ